MVCIEINHWYKGLLLAAIPPHFTLEKLAIGYSMFSLICYLFYHFEFSLKALHNAATFIITKMSLLDLKFLVFVYRFILFK